MRNLTVGELAAAKAAVISLHSIEKVSRLVQVIETTPHGGFPVVDDDLLGLVLRSHIVEVLQKKWFFREKRRAEEREVREVMAAGRQRCGAGIKVAEDEMEMYVDLNPFVNLTAHTVVESTSVAKAVVLFRQVGLRHLLILPKFRGPAVSQREHLILVITVFFGKFRDG